MSDNSNQCLVQSALISLKTNLLLGMRRAPSPPRGGTPGAQMHSEVRRRKARSPPAVHKHTFPRSCHPAPGGVVLLPQALPGTEMQQHAMFIVIITEHVPCQSRRDWRNLPAKPLPVRGQEGAAHGTLGGPRAQPGSLPAHEPPHRAAFSTAGPGRKPNRSARPAPGMPSDPSLPSGGHFVNSVIVQPLRCTPETGAK